MSAEPPVVSAVPSPSIDRESPWPGLRSYDESMHAFFFGRTAEVEELLRLVRRDAVALFYGQSGLGKSSVLQAGLFPKLRAAEMLPVHIRLRYTEEFPHPVEQVFHEVAAAARAAGGEVPAASAGSSLFEYFYDDTHEFWSARNRVLTPVLVFDQFEEIFTLGGRNATAHQRREELLVQLADLAAHRAPAALVQRFEESPELAARFSTDRTRCRMLFSMREDFLPELGSLRKYLPTLPNGGLRLQRLRGTQAQEVLERAGAHLLEPGAAERIIRFVAAEKSGGATRDLADLEVEPALLNVVASELNHRRRQRGLELISADLVQGAREEILNDFYERALAGLDPRVREFIEEQLLTTTGFRDSIAVEDAEASFGISRELIAQLVDRRLLRIDERFQLQRVELTHDLLTTVVKSSRDRRRERQAAEAAQRRAEEDKRTAESAAAQAQSKLRATRIRAAVVGVMALLGLGVIVPSILLTKANSARREAEDAKAKTETVMKQVAAAKDRASQSLDEAKQALTRYIIVQANEHLARANYDAARLVLTLADRGEKEMQLFPPEQLNLLSAALDEPAVLRLAGVLQLAPGLRHVMFAPGGRLFTVDERGTLQVAIAATVDGKSVLTPETPPGELGQAGVVSALDVEWTEAPCLAVASEAGTIRILDLDSGTLLASLPIPPRQIEKTDEATRSTGATGTTDVLGKGSPSGPSHDAAVNTGVESGTGAGAGAAVSTASGVAHAVALRFSQDNSKLAAAISDGRVIVWGRKQPRWEGTATIWWTDAAQVIASDVTRTEADLGWLLDDTLLFTHGAGAAWLPAPTTDWNKAAPIERFSTPGARQAQALSGNRLDDNVFMTARNETRVQWYRFNSQRGPDTTASELRTTTVMPERVLAHAVIEDRDLLLSAMRDGGISVHRLHAAASTGDDALQLIQTVTGPKSPRVQLAVRPDGQLVAAAADDGRVFLYRVDPPPAVAPGTGSTGTRLVHSPAGWWQLSADGRILAPGGIAAAESLDAAQASGQPLLVHSLYRDPAAGDLAFASLTPADPQAGAPSAGVWSFRTRDWLWSRPMETLGLPLVGPAAPFEQVVQFSPDGSAVLIAGRTTATLQVRRAQDGTEVVPTIQLRREPRQVTWSSNGRNVAVATTDLNILVVDVDPATAAADRIIATVPARSSELTTLALDPTGEVLGYVTPDRRLVLDFIARDSELPSLVAPLSGLAPSALAFAPDSRGLVLLTPDGLTRREAGRVDTDEIQWINQRRPNGFSFSPFSEDAGSDLRDLNVATWRNDAGTRAAAAFRLLLVQWVKWHASARTTIARLPALESARITTELQNGRALAEAIVASAGNQPALQDFGSRVAAAVADPMALYAFFGATPRWSQVASYLDDHELTQVSVDQAEKLFPQMIERLESEDTIGGREQALMKQVVATLAATPDRTELLREKRAVLRSDKLFAAEEWTALVLASPDNRLLLKEAEALFESAAYEPSSAFYTELEKREPGNIRYATLNAQNYRFRNAWSEALPRYLRVIERAQAANDPELAGEASVCAGWCFEGLQRLDEADAAVARGAEFAPQSTWVLRYASAYFLDRGKPGRVGEWTARLVELAPDPTHQIVRATYLVAQLDLDAARKLMRAALTSKQATPQNYFDAGELSARLGAKDDLETGATWLLDAYNKTSDRSLEFRALGALGPLWTRLNNYSGAISSYRLRLENYAPSEIERAAAFAYSAWLGTLTRDFTFARDMLDKAIARDAKLGDQPGHDRTFLWWQAGLYYEWTADPAAALAAYRQTANYGGVAGERVLVAAVHRLAPPEEALAAVERALEQYPGDVPLRLERAALLLAADPARAARELAALDDGSLEESALRAQALRGQAGVAADRLGATLDDPFAEQSLELAGLRALAYQQTGDETQRHRALIALTEALWNRHRGNLPLHQEFGLGVLREDPLFALATEAVTARFESPESLLALARLEIRLAAILPAGGDRFRRENRARGWLEYGVNKDKLPAEVVQNDAELAPFGPEAAESTETGSETDTEEETSSDASHEDTE